MKADIVATAQSANDGPISICYTREQNLKSTRDSTFVPPSYCGLESPALLKSIEHGIAAADVDPMRSMEHRHRCETLAEWSGRNRHIRHDCAIRALAYARLDHPGHEFRISFDICDEIKQWQSP